MDGTVTILATVDGFDGIIHCHGYLLDHRCAEIQLIWKSPLAAEARAELTAADQELRFQVLLTEIVAGR